MTLVIAIHIILLILLTISSGFFSGSEIALFSLSPHKVKTFRDSDDQRLNTIARLLRQPRDVLVVVFVFNTVVNILLQNVSSSLFGDLSGWTLKVGVPLAITLILGEIIPKFFALEHNVAISRLVAPIVSFLHDRSYRLFRSFTQLTGVISNVMFFFLRRDEVISKEEIQHVLRASTESGVLHETEVPLVDGFLDLREAQVKELMRPKEDIIAYDIAEPLTRLIHLFVDLECSRVPVYKDNIDALLGIISARDFFIQKPKISRPSDLMPFLTKPQFIPETAPAPLALAQLDSCHQEVALVVDEYGSITGLISYEDIIEEVVGEIKDRRDERGLYTRSGENIVIASGKLELAELEELFGIKLTSPNNMVTIGGWLIEAIGDIPKSGTNYQTDQLLFHILAADPNRIRRVYIRRLDTPTGGAV